MKNAVILALGLVIALMALSHEYGVQPVIEDTTKGQTFGLRSASEETARLWFAMPSGVRIRPLADGNYGQRVSGPSAVLAAGIVSQKTNAATDHAHSTNEHLALVPEGPPMLFAPCQPIPPRNFPRWMERKA